MRATLHGPRSGLLRKRRCAKAIDAHRSRGRAGALFTSVAGWRIGRCRLFPWSHVGRGFNAVRSTREVLSSLRCDRLPKASKLISRNITSIILIFNVRLQDSSLSVAAQSIHWGQRSQPQCTPSVDDSRRARPCALSLDTARPGRKVSLKRVDGRVGDDEMYLPMSLTLTEAAP